MDFEQQPASKRDLAEVKEELVGLVGQLPTKDDLERFATKDDLERFATKDDLRSAVKELALKEDVRDLTQAVKDVLQGPGGVIKRLERVEARIGIA